MSTVSIRSLEPPALQKSDAELVIRARSGDGWAEEALYRRHAPKLLRAARRILGNDADALDVLQEAFVVMFEKLHQLRDPGVFSAWLMRTGVRRALRKLQRRRWSLRFFDEPTNVEQLFQPRPECAPEIRLQLLAVEAVLVSLPPRQRVAWVLRYVEGYELTEVAAACDVSLATAKRWIAAAQAKVKSGGCDR